jgi:hypothetical protein
VIRPDEPTPIKRGDTGVDALVVALRPCRSVVLVALAVAMAAPAPASAQISAPAAAEAHEQGFDAREALGSEVSLDQSGAGEGLFRVRLGDGDVVTTHGPDTTATAGEHGTAIEPGDPERDPVCATTTAQHILYGAPADQASRYPEVVPGIRAIVRRMNAVLNSESVESGGGEADYRVRCDGAGEVRVDGFTGPAGDDSFEAVVDAARAAGFDDPDTKYTIFYETEATSYCGIASLYDDERLSASNANNSGTSYAITHDGCWDGDTPMHENGHNMGAVQPGAPNSTGAGLHCNQEHDVMCYSPDGGDRNQGGAAFDCADHKHFDCAHDDYFDTAPEAGEYLASHWNLGSPLNRFLNFGAPAAIDNVAPVARDDAATVEKSVPRDVSVLANDDDPDGDPLTIVSVSDPARGSAVISPGATSVRYTPDLGYTGPDLFTYRIGDGRGGQAVATARLSVRDTRAPTVVAVSPADRATNIATSANPAARFSEPMSAATVNATSFRLVRRGRTTPVRATVRYSGTSRTATLDPSAGLARGATYTATVTSAARDRVGNRAAARTWSFTVRR